MPLSERPEPLLRQNTPARQGMHVQIVGRPRQDRRWPNAQQEDGAGKVVEADACGLLRLHSVQGLV